MVMPSSSTINIKKENKNIIRNGCGTALLPAYMAHMIPLITLLTLLVTDYDTVSDVV